MKELNKIKYIPLKYQNEIRSVSNPKKEGINLNNPNKIKVIQPLKNINFNNYNFMKNKYLNYQYNNTEINNNVNYNTNLNRFNNKTQANYYSSNYKEKIMNNLKDNINIENVKKKKNFYLNVNFNLNQNYTIPNINANKFNRSLSVQNYYETKNNINNINNQINLDNNSYNNNIFNSNYKKNKATNSFKSIYEKENLYLKGRNNKEMNNYIRNNKSYTKIINNKALELQPQKAEDIKNNTYQKNTDINTNTNSLLNSNKRLNPNKNFIYLKNNNMNINNKHFKNIKIITEPINNNYNNNINNENNLENNNDQIISDLEYKMKNLLKENKTDSKGKNYNIIRKIFEEAINILNFTKNEKKFLKLILLKYHEIVFAFSQENKLLKQSSENLNNLNFSLDKKYLDLDKKYKIILKENQDMKNILSIKNNYEINFNENNIVNRNKNNINENMMYKSIKDMDFEMNDSYKKHEKYENDNDYFERDIKIINLENKEDKEILFDKDKDSKRIKSEDIKRRREEFNRLNINDLDSLYFNDKINDTNCYNSKKNYDKVPRIKFLNKCKL